MTWRTPTWWQAVILLLGAARLTRLIGWDDLTIPLRRRVTGMGDEEHSQWAHVIDTAKQHDLDPWSMTLGDWFDHLDSAQVPPLVADHGISYEGGVDEPDKAYFHPPLGHGRYYLSKMLRCPWCVGFWISVTGWLAWLAWPHAVTILAVPLAISEAVGLISKNLDP